MESPAWWVERIRSEQPEWWEAILRGGNGHGPLTLRVNRRRATVAITAGSVYRTQD